jgi:hypothetical protein|uniref:photosystem I assembly protein ycf4 n=1 Tax=Cryptomonas gyropyrenoidosa TaxID=233257 RepID=UPI00279D4230|nr:photosystem I assembly protein ycf4 [Cryptomonas gyropyrenoidosa]WFQ82954.1 photosystem I assembly protein ycf4 [Cryptomonas gyropyrenoidosa]
MKNHVDSIRYDLIIGSRRPSNYFWVVASFTGGLSFFLVGISSYFHLNLGIFGRTESISFLPQGILMTFYGCIGVFLSMFLFLSIIFNIGGGYNKYDKIQEKIEIFRLGFPILSKEVFLSYNFKEIKSIKLTIKEGLNPKREIYMCTKDQRQIPLTRVGEPLLLSSVEEEAVNLSMFLNIPLED